jgi:hypothetical protein
MLMKYSPRLVKRSAIFAGIDANRPLASGVRPR